MFTAEGRISVTFNKVFDEGNLIEFEVNKLFILPLHPQPPVNT
jgi:hypothetical protein